MGREQVSRFLEQAGLTQRLMVLEQSSATVELAARAMGCESGRIAKTLSFLVKPAEMGRADRAVLVVAAGDVKVDNQKYKAVFHQKARMIPGEQVQATVGHAPGGVCPFAVKPGVAVYLDTSLRRFETVFPAAGDDHSAVELSLAELESCSGATDWVDVCTQPH